MRTCFVPIFHQGASCTPRGVGRGSWPGYPSWVLPESCAWVQGDVMWLKYGCLHVLVPQGRKNGEEAGWSPLQDTSASPPILQDTEHLSVTHASAGSCSRGHAASVAAAHSAEPSAALGAGWCSPACSGAASCGMKDQDHWQQKGASAGGLCRSRAGS